MLDFAKVLTKSCRSLAEVFWARVLGLGTCWDAFERDLKLRAKIFLFKSEFTEHVTKQSNLVINSRRKGKAHQDPARNLPATRSDVL